MAHRARRVHNFRALSKPKSIKSHEQKHYWPYIPVILLVISTFMLSILQPMQRRGVLAYATNVSSSGLLSSTNQQRADGGSSQLTISSSLTTAAQSKANDMIARNYWSHNTPDGKEPWIFIDAAGYKYERAGENLAYGFATSSDTVKGWMNSPTHKDNLMDTSFSEVGFGYANGDNYNSSGPETVVVAMYGKPQVLASSESAQPTPPPARPEQTPPNQQPAADVESKPITTDFKIVTEPSSLPISRVQTITSGQAPWAIFVVGIFTGLASMLLLVKHTVGLRHFLRNGEKFVLHHPLLDTLLVASLLIGVFLSQTTGIIR